MANKRWLFIPGANLVFAPCFVRSVAAIMTGSARPLCCLFTTESRGWVPVSKVTSPLVGIMNAGTSCWHSAGSMRYVSASEWSPNTRRRDDVTLSKAFDNMPLTIVEGRIGTSRDVPAALVCVVVGIEIAPV